MGEDIRISKASLGHKDKDLEEENDIVIGVAEDDPLLENKSQKSRQSSKSGKSGKSRKSSKSKKNMFKSNKSNKSVKTEVNQEKETEFEESVRELLKEQDWEGLEVAAVDQLDTTKAKSPKGYLYLGIALFKMEFYEQACRAFQKSSEIKPDDA